ncbi:MAG: phosphoribosyltransferase [Bdellovibrio sp.]|nr:phosphoribosyltransferase [Bdellovibrio sp.]
MKLFTNRSDAGELLGQKLLFYKKQKPLVIGIPNGGIPVAMKVAQVLQCPLDILMVKKICAPQQPEVAIGAIAEGGETCFDDKMIDTMNISGAYLEQTCIRSFRELRTQYRKISQYHPHPSWRNKVLILVDDGVATGATLTAALLWAKQKAPKKIIVATPVGSKNSIEILKQMADDVICLTIPDNFSSVSSWYEDFDQVSEVDILTILKEADSFNPPSAETEKTRQ